MAGPKIFAKNNTLLKKILIKNITLLMYTVKIQNYTKYNTNTIINCPSEL